MLAQVDAREEAKRIGAPTMIMLGSAEGAAFKEAAAWIHANIRGSKVVEVPAAGNASVRERPDFVVQQLRSFLG